VTRSLGHFLHGSKHALRHHCTISGHPHRSLRAALSSTATMADRHIICVEPASGRGDVVVVEVQQHGAQPLDLRLVGCEGENPYVTTSKMGHLIVFHTCSF
jgi:hypothetical protein